MSLLRFIVPGHPVPKGRPRFFNGHAVTPKDTVEFERIVKKAVTIAATLLKWILPKKQQAYRVTTRFYRQYRFKGGDIDNLFKSAADACNKVAFQDDCRIMELHAYIYQDAANERTEVEVEEIP